MLDESMESIISNAVAAIIAGLALTGIYTIFNQIIRRCREPLFVFGLFNVLIILSNLVMLAVYYEDYKSRCAGARVVLTIGETGFSYDVPFRYCPPGEFEMGNPMTLEEITKKYSPKNTSAVFTEVPQHKVTLTQGFYLAEHPVTLGEFRRFVEATGYETMQERHYPYRDNWKSNKLGQNTTHPVVYINFQDACAYVDWLNDIPKSEPKLGGLTPVYRLPTEAEWEYACRAGTKTDFFWGDEEKDGKGYLNVAGSEDGYSGTSPVCSFKPNPYGLYDMLGNVLEWTSDPYGVYPKENVTDPKVATSSDERVLRGGDWKTGFIGSRCSMRYYGYAYNFEGNERIGFRIAFSLTKK